MAENLTVPRGQTYRFDDDVEPGLRQYVSTVAIEKLDDLVDSGLVGSKNDLTSMLDSARAATDTALQSIARSPDAAFVPGTRRIDLGRFRPFAIRSAEVAHADRDAFWRIVREVPSDRIATLKRDTRLTGVIASPQLVIGLVAAQDVTVEPGATLHFAGSVKTLKCRDLLIKKTGRIEVKGSGLVVRARAIKGDQ